jgi:ATP-dependent Lon protease
MFLATANVLSQIPEPLRDRMEILEIPGYLREEKVEIGRRHLLPKQLERHGLTGKHLSIAPPVCRKIARGVAGGGKGPGRLSAAEMETLLGRPRFQPEERRKQKLPGVVQGLAWTPFGGDVLYVEAVASKGKGALQLTGSLGDVMSESARLALSYLKSHAERFGLDAARFDTNDLHLHFPAGAIKKDGPSAGIAIASAFVGALLGKKAPMDLAMTGELTVVGEVLPIGGVREKVLAAKNFGITRVVLPAGNEAEAKELKPELVEGIEILFVARFEQVFQILFGAAPVAAPKSKKGRRAARRKR